jgi:PAS domain S-box-containing protein
MPLRDVDGSMIGITGVAIDITDRQHAEDELARSLKFAQSVNEATPDIVYVYNLDTNQTISSNRSVLKILGYTPEQIQHMGHEFFPQTIHPDDMRTLPEQYTLLAQLADGAIHTSEYRLRTAAGDWRWLSSREVIFQRHLDGTPELVLGIATDITERKESEDEIRHRSEELAQANRELAGAARLKDEFLANMSHELRTPLTSILGRSELLQDDLSGPLTEFQRRSVRGIEESGHHLLELINDILDLSKIEAGKMVLEIQPIPMAMLAHACVHMITQTAQRKQLRVHTILDPAVAIIDADPRRLKQILVNLLGNAAKFTPDGGEVGLEIHGNHAAHTVDLIVWDTGIGIDASDQQRLFQPFVQIDSGLTRQYEGTGLGLALVERLTTMHGGTVSLVSTLGQGSRFTVHLPWEPTNIPGLAPVVPHEPEQPLVISDIPSRSHPALILLVEDNSETRTIITEYLTLHGYRVTQAQTGQAALVCARTELPTLIIMDIQLPDMDGITVTCTLRADPSYANIPILVLSAHALSGDNERALAAGANAYMSKPVRLAELIATMTALLRPDQ